jgi:hypothetical protein
LIGVGGEGSQARGEKRDVLIVFIPPIEVGDSEGFSGGINVDHFGFAPFLDLVLDF